MYLSETTLILASGFWLTLMVACFIFAIVATRSRRQLSDLDRIIDTQRGHIQKLSLSMPELAIAEEDGSGENGELLRAQQYADSLKQQIASMDELQKQQLITTEEELATVTDELAGIKQDFLASEALVNSLQSENGILEQQVKTLTDILDVGDLATMREIIVNFTEETRGLLATITDLEIQRDDLLQQLEDTESNEKGTVGAVVGLKRKLSLAEDRVKEVEAAYDLLVEDSSTTD